jgi:beta-N-acetylhexosaminidase
MGRRAVVAEQEPVDRDPMIHGSQIGSHLQMNIDPFTNRLYCSNKATGQVEPVLLRSDIPEPRVVAVKKTGIVLPLFLAGALAGLPVAYYVGHVDGAKSNMRSSDTLSAPEAGTDPAAEEPGQAAPEPEPAPMPEARTPESCVASLPLDFKLGQMIMAGTNKRDAAQHREIFSARNVGGAIVMTKVSGENVGEPNAAEIAVLREGHLAPLTIGTDQEGGKVVRFKEQVGELPGAASLVPERTEDMTDEEYQQKLDKAVEEARKIYTDHFAKLAQLGITAVFAPVVDLSGNVEDETLKSRMYSDDPQVVTRFAEAAIDGMQASNIAPTIKHFVGLEENTDVQPSVSPNLAELEQAAVIPYRELANKNVNVMVGNQSIPGLTETDQPVSQSAAATEYLRNKLGYKDAILYTDALEAKGVSSSVAEAAVRSWAAGTDVALFAFPEKGKSTAEQLDAIINHGKDSVVNGQLPQETVDRAAHRILSHKAVDPCVIADTLAPIS